MNPYALTYTSTARKQLRQLDPPVRRRLVDTIEALTHDPRPHGCRALQGRPGYRLRVGDWRIIYEVDDTAVIVLVIKVGPRGSVYR